MPNLSNKAKSLMWFINNLPSDVRSGYYPAYGEVVSEMYHSQQQMFNPAN